MTLRQLGSLALLLFTAGCATNSRIAELYPDVAEHGGAEVKAVRFVGGEPFGFDTLQVMIETKPTHCSLLGFPICLPFGGFGRVRRTLDPGAVVRDAGRLTVFYRREGYFGTRVTPRVEPEAEGDEDVQVTFVIRRGDAVTLDTLRLLGLGGVLDSTAVLRRLPLQAGEIFDLDEFGLSVDQVLRELQNSGRAYADVLRSYDVDTLNNRASASITAVPGPVVKVDSIIVTGVNQLGRRPALRQLGFRAGDVLKLPTLADAQRNLYNLELVQIASVTVAPDSLQVSPGDSTTATILVAIAENNEYQAEAGLGFGTEECLGAEGKYVDRSFHGAGRRLALDGSLSKVGVGGPTESKFIGNNICGGSLADVSVIDTIGSALDYQISAEVTQPYFLGPRNQLTANVYAEHLSQVDFAREAIGARGSITHRLALRTNLIGSLEVERGSTVAEPVLFCTAFQICTPEDFERMTTPRYRNLVGLNYIQDRTDHPLDATRGYIVRTGVAWAAPFLGSDVTFSRWTGEAAAYRVVRPSWVLAASLRLGNFFQSASLNPERDETDFLPPEERFYAGGANSVRGYTRNELGPGIYFARWAIPTGSGFVPAKVLDVDPEDAPDDAFFVRDPENPDSIIQVLQQCDDCVEFVPTGGTSMMVANIELRLPSPFFRRQLRLAAFVDAGSVTTGNLWDMRDFRITPGVGLRIITPVGPARVDMAYNPYNPPTSALFVATQGRIVAGADNFTVDPPSFWGRLKFHIAIGQAF